MKKKYGLSFVYSVRFRMGPFGFAFDNKHPNASIVERIIGRSQVPSLFRPYLGPYLRPYLGYI